MEENVEGYQPRQETQPQTVQVDVRFLQELLNYLTTRPYNEVHQFVDVLTGRNPYNQPPKEE